MQIPSEVSSEEQKPTEKELFQLNSELKSFKLSRIKVHLILNIIC